MYHRRFRKGRTTHRIPVDKQYLVLIFEFLTALNTEVAVYWHVTECSSMQRHKHFARMRCLHLHGTTVSHPVTTATSTALRLPYVHTIRNKMYPSRHAPNSPSHVTP